MFISWQQGLTLCIYVKYKHKCVSKLITPKLHVMTLVGRKYMYVNCKHKYASSYKLLILGISIEHATTPGMSDGTQHCGWSEINRRKIACYEFHRTQFPIHCSCKAVKHGAFSTYYGTLAWYSFYYEIELQLNHACINTYPNPIQKVVC